MPTYEYRCDECGHKFEEFQSISAPPVDHCPKCGGVPRRLISGGTGLIFKGSGFYITDYRDKKYKDAESKERGDKTGPKAGKDTASSGESSKKTDSSSSGSSTNKPSGD